MSSDIVDDLPAFYPSVPVDNDFGQEQADPTTDSSTVEIEDLFRAGVEAILSTLVPMGTAIDDIKQNTETLTEIRDILKEQNTETNPAVAGSGGKSKEEIELESAKLDLRNREFEYRKLKNADEEERRQRAEAEAARKRREAQFDQFMSDLPKKTEAIFRNPLNLIPGLGKLLTKGLGLAGRGIGALAKKAKKPKSAPSTETTEETVTETVETTPVQETDETENIAEATEVGGEDSSVIEAVPEPTEDIIDAEYYIEDDTGPAPLALPSPEMLALPPPDDSDIIDAEYSIADDSGLVDSGAQSEAEEDRETAFEANSLLADTLEDPEDSEFVDAITDPMASIGGGEGGGMGDLGKGLIAAAIAAVLGPNMDEIFSLVNRIATFFEEKLYPDLIEPFGEVLIKVFDGIGDAFIDFFNKTAPALGGAIASVANAITAFNDGITPYLKDIGAALGSAFVSFIENGERLLDKITDKLIALMDDPVGQLKELGEAVGSMLSTALLSLIVPLGEELEVTMKYILPEWMGGYNDKVKTAHAEEVRERVDQRHREYAAPQGTYPVSTAEAEYTVEAGGAMTATGGTYAVGSMVVYAASVQLAMNESGEGVMGSTTNNNTNNNVTVVTSPPNNHNVPGGS